MRRWGAALVALTVVAAPLHAEPAAVKDLRATLQGMIDKGMLPNAQVAIEQGGKTLASFRLGYADVGSKAPLRDDSIFRLYSMSKPITSVAIMMLVEGGKLSLDDPASRFLPEFTDMRVWSGGTTLEDMQTVPAARSITIRDLMTHSSGLSYPFMGNTPVQQHYRRFGVMRDTAVGKQAGDAKAASGLDQLVERLGKAPLLHQPGERFSYSYSTTMLGAIVERASGQSLDAFLKQRIFDPLDMRDTGFVVSDAQLPRLVTNYAATKDGMAVAETAQASEYRDPQRLRDGGGALAGTMRDYLHFAEMIANDGTWHGQHLLKAETVQAMTTPQLRTGGTGLEDTAFGLGFAVGDAASEAIGGLPVGAASWAGSGNTYFFADPAYHAVAVIMTNELTPPGFTDRTDDLRHALNVAAVKLMKR